MSHDCAEYTWSLNASTPLRYDLYSLRQFMEYQQAQSLDRFQFGGAGYGDMGSEGPCQPPPFQEFNRIGFALQSVAKCLLLTHELCCCT